jgi:dTDP-4-dehydrorhamnose 3,5-epimerase
MIFHETSLQGVFLIDLEPHADERGFLARTFCAEEFTRRGLNPGVKQASLSSTHRRGTLRGMHYQDAPATEDKLVRCIRGSIHDVVVDLRPSSPTFLSHYAVELSAEHRQSLYIPAMCAHGCQTLIDGTEVLYLMSGFHSPQHERGLRYDDPALGIAWPIPVTVISPKDAAWPLLDAKHPSSHRGEAR